MTRVGIMISIRGMIKVGTEATRIKIGPNLKKEVNLTMRIGSTTPTLEIITPEAEACLLPDLRNTQWNRSLMITLMSDRRTHKQLQDLIILTSYDVLVEVGMHQDLQGIGMTPILQLKCKCSKACHQTETHYPALIKTDQAA